MIRLSKLTDYAIVLLAAMTQSTALRATSNQLAAATAIPEPTVAKLLKQLAATGLVQSTRGVAGGYSVVQDAKTMTMRAVIEAIEGPIAITSCVEGAGGNTCCAEAKCPLRGRWDPVNAAIVTALNGVTLADMMGHGHGHAPTTKFVALDDVAQKIG